MVEAHPRGDAGLSRGLEHHPVVIDGRGIMPAALGLDPGPLDRQPMMSQSELGEQREVLAISRREAVPVERARGVPGALPRPPVRRRARALAISVPDDLAAAIATHQPGDRVGVTFQRGDQHHTVTVTLDVRSPSGN